MRAGTKIEALELLGRLSAPPRLVRHVELVGEAADALRGALRGLDVAVDEGFVRAAVVLHDVGKVVHPGELDGPGGQHEAAGEALLLAEGVTPALARICVTHAAWHREDVSLEERVVALADKLWKGVRKARLETMVIDMVAERLGVDRWDVFTDLDTVFEEIAAGGAERLERSRV